MSNLDVFESLLSVLPRGKYSQKKLWEVSLIDPPYIESLADHWEPAKVWVEARKRATAPYTPPKAVEATQLTLF